MRKDEYHISEITPLLENVTSSMWLRSTKLKYIHLHIDTRRGNICWLSNRHNESMLKEDLEEAIENTPDHGKEEEIYPYNKAKNKKKRAYFARCIKDFDTEKDNYCIEEIESLGYYVVDPNEFFTEEEYEEKSMEMFRERIRECDVFFFKGLEDGRITAGVMTEIACAFENNVPVYEIPKTHDRGMTVEETRQYLKEIGVR